MIKLKGEYASTFSFANFFSRIFINNGKISIVAVNLFTLWVMLTANGNFSTENTNNLSQPLTLFIVMGLVTYMAATMFLDQVDNVIMTLLTCLSMDLHKNDPDDEFGSGRFGPPTFHDKRNKHKEKVKREKEANGNLI